MHDEPSSSSDSTLDSQTPSHLHKRSAHDEKGQAEANGFTCLSKIAHYIVPYGIETYESTRNNKTFLLFKPNSILPWSRSYYHVWEQVRDALRDQFGYYTRTGFIREDFDALIKERPEFEWSRNLQGLFMLDGHLMRTEDLAHYGYHILDIIRRKQKEIKETMIPNLKCGISNFAKSFRLRRKQGSDIHHMNYKEYGQRINEIRNKHGSLLNIMKMLGFEDDEPDDREMELKKLMDSIKEDDRHSASHGNVKEKILELLKALSSFRKLVVMEYEHLGLVEEDIRAYMRGEWSEKSVPLPFVMIPEKELKRWIPDHHLRTSLVEADAAQFKDGFKDLKYDFEYLEFPKFYRRRCPFEKEEAFLFCVATVQAMGSS